MGEKKSKRDETPEERKERKRLKKEKKETYSYQESTELKNLSTSTIQEYLDKHSIHDSSLFRPIIDFKHIQFPNVIHQVILDLKFTAPTPIQAATWPSLLSGRDLIGIAATGSGKTYSFGIPALIHILNKNIVPSTKPVSVASPQVLILAPTRELALQTVSTLQVFCNAVKSNIVCLYGGAPKHEQKRSLLENGGAQIVVATPGRLMDLLGLGFSNNEDSNPCMNLENVGYFILDEADRMLDMGFEKDIQKIANGITGTKQTVMFSATWPIQIQSLANSYLVNPIKVTIGITDKLSANLNISQLVTVCLPQEKEQKLLQLLKSYHDKKNRVLVFVLYKKEASRIEMFLKRNGYGNCASIHGDLPQQGRIDALEGFKNGRTPLLIATDVAARGLDIPNVEYVINFTYPLTTEEYCHRIGRTGRAGNKGVSHTLFTINEKSLSGSLINVLKGAKMAVPAELMAFGTTVKKKLDPNYGAFVKEGVDMNQKGTKVVFSDSE